MGEIKVRVYGEWNSPFLRYDFVSAEVWIYMTYVATDLLLMRRSRKSDG